MIPQAAAPNGPKNAHPMTLAAPNIAAYIEKPFDPHHLKKVLKDVLEKKEK